MESGVIILLFTDDTDIFITGRNPQGMYYSLNKDLVKIHKWLCCNKLSLSVFKTHCIISVQGMKRWWYQQYGD